MLYRKVQNADFNVIIPGPAVGSRGLFLALFRTVVAGPRGGQRISAYESMIFQAVGNPADPSMHNMESVTGCFKLDPERVLLDRELDQAINQVGVGQPGGLPKLCIHADCREAGHGIDLVEENFAVGGNKYVNARHTHALEGLACGKRSLLHLLQGRRLDLCRYDQLRDGVIDVLLFIGKDDRTA